MKDIRVDRRAFLIASSAAMVWPGAAWAASGTGTRPLKGVVVRCAGSGEWSDLSLGGLAEQLEPGRVFTSRSEFGGGDRIRGQAELAVLGGSLSDDAGIERMVVEVDFTPPGEPDRSRLFTAMVVRRGGAAAPAVRCVVPMDLLGGVRLVLKAEKCDGTTESYLAELGSRRGVHGAAVTNARLVRGVVRMTGGAVSTDWPACVVASMRPVTERGAGEEKSDVGG